MPVNRGILSSTTDCIEDYQIDQVSFQPNGDALQKSNDLNGRKKKPSRRLQLAILTFVLLVIAVIVILVVTLKKTDSWTETGKIHNNRRLKLDEVLTHSYRPPGYGLYWITDNSYLDYDFGIVRKYVDKDDVDTILTFQEYIESNARPSTVVISPDDNWLLIANRTRMLYRHSFYADFYVKNLKTRSVVKIKPDNDQTSQVRIVSWANNGSAMVFVYKNNVYYVPTVEDHPIRYYQLTTDGVPKKVFNGVPDWVYEEEILLSGKAFEVSDDGKFLSFVTFNASTTKDFRYAQYGSSQNRYPEIRSIAYPKAGVENPTIKISIVNLIDVAKENSSTTNFMQYTKSLTPPASISYGDYYYAVMNWSPGDELYVQWMNRAQNESVCVTYPGKTGKGTIVQSHSTPGGWIDSNYIGPIYAKDNSHYITLLPKNNFKHLAKVTMNPKNGAEVQFLTDGDFMIDEISCYNADKQILYFRSTETSPRQRHIYEINVKTNVKKCITCGLLKDSDGTECTYHTIVFSTKCSYAFIVCNGPYPTVTYRMIMSNLSFVNLTNNQQVKEHLKQRDIPKSIFYAIKSDGYDIAVKETRPADFDPKKKYPVLLSVYGGPGTQKVSDKYEITFDHYIVSSNDVILINFDARGTGAYGYKFMYAVYKQLGKYEAEDAINVAKYMCEKPYVDVDKIAIWGWSYGGFYSSTVMGMSSNVIKTAVAVAPVTDWRYYDTVYTERYMGMPTTDDNYNGYESTSVLNKAENFRGKNFLLIHGTADDNVHFQNAAQLASSLVRHKIKFRAQFYTDGRHSIHSGYHVYYLIADFLLAHLRNAQIPANSTFGLDRSR